MEMTVLDTNFQAVYILDQFESFIWVDKLYEPGTFELYTSITPDILTYIKPNYYIRNDDSDHVMVIEDISIESDSESGDHIKAVGRSLESILDRRIVWSQTKFNNVYLQTAITTLLNNAIISPSIADRKISNFLPFTPSTDSKITSIKMSAEYTGDNLLDVIQSLCEESKIGFKIILTEDNEFEFSLYNGTDRSYNQTENSYVAFSSEFDNIINSNYTDRNSIYKNIALVAGEGEGTSRKRKVVGVSKGISRKELYVDARDIQKGDLSKSKYLALLQKRGVQKLEENNLRKEFDGKCETSRMYIYGRDFFLGDVVEIANEYGIEASARVTEFTWNYASNEIETYPTFEAIEETIVTGKNRLATTLENLVALNTSGEWTENIYSYDDVDFTVNLDAYDRVIGVTIDGSNTLTTSIVFNLGAIDATVTDLVLSGCTGGSSSTYRISQYDANSSTEKAINYSGDTLITSIDLTHTNYVRFVLAKSKTVNNITLYPMVRSVAESDTFEPYDATL